MLKSDVWSLTPNTGLQHPSSKGLGTRKRCLESSSKHWFTTSFLQGGRWRKAMLGVWPGSNMYTKHNTRGRSEPMPGVQLQALVYYILPPRRKMPESDVEHHHAPGYYQVTSKKEGCRKAMSRVQLRTLVYNILSPRRKGAGKRCSECGLDPVCILNTTHAVDLSRCLESSSKHWFTTFFLQGGRWRKAMLGVWPGSSMYTKHYTRGRSEPMSGVQL